MDNRYSFQIMPCNLLYSNTVYTFHYLTGDASAPSTTHEAEIEMRVAEYLEMEDADVVIDLREHNHSISDMKFKLFWEQCKAYLQEVTAVHERWHDQVTYLAAAISVHDLIEQVKKRCPEGMADVIKSINMFWWCHKKILVIPLALSSSIRELS